MEVWSPYVKRKLLQIFILSYFWCWVSKWGTQIEDIFLSPSIFVIIFQLLVVGILRWSAILLILIWRLLSIRIFIFEPTNSESYFDFLLIDMSSLREIFDLEKSLNYLVIALYEGVSFPQIVTNSIWLSITLNIFFIVLSNCTIFYNFFIVHDQRIFKNIKKFSTLNIYNFINTETNNIIS